VEFQANWQNTIACAHMITHRHGFGLRETD